MRALSLAALAAASLALLAFAPAAAAEEIVLASGARYDAQEIRILEHDVRFTVVLGEGRATMALPFERIDGDSLVGLMAARLDPRLGATHLRLARVALDRGLLGIAAHRFRRAAIVDPALAPERDAGLLAVRDAETALLLDAAERAIKQGRNDLAADKAREAFGRAEAGTSLSQRARTIADLAGATAERDRLRAQAKETALAQAQAAATAAAYGDARGKARKHFDAALLERGKAADPDAGPSVVRRALESAETNLRDARRWLAAARDRDPSRATEVDEDDRTAFDLLVATHVDLAEAYRLDGAFDKARDRVRAALVLDPQNTRATATLGRIETDLHPVPEPAPYYGPYAPTYGPTIGYAYPGVPYVRGWVGPASTFHYGVGGYGIGGFGIRAWHYGSLWR